MKSEESWATRSGKMQHPIIRLVLENPMSAFNTAAIIFGGGFVYSSNESRMEQMESRIVKIEAAGLRDAASLQQRTIARP